MNTFVYLAYERYKEKNMAISIRFLYIYNYFGNPPNYIELSTGSASLETTLSALP